MAIGDEMTPIISVKKLTKKYNEEVVLRDVNFEVMKGEILVVLGDSGAGKTTLMSILAGLDKAFEGVVSYSDDLFENSKVPLPIVFQDFDQLLPWYSVEKNILLPYDRKEFTDRDREILSFVGLDTHLHKQPHELSGGMKQRTAIARSLLSDGKVIFMDEPFGSLDTARRQQLQQLIIEINKKYVKTIVFITHDLEEAQLLAHRTLVVGTDGTVKEV